MCRIEERVEFGTDGRPMTSQRPRLCEKAQARGGRLCRDAVVVPHRYNPTRGSTSRDDTPSPINPPTPTSSGTYLVQTRRPSGSGSRPSTRDGQRSVSTEIIIQLGSKKDKVKKYPSISVSTKPYDRSSLGSRGSNEAAIEAIGSEASYTLRTGFPEAPLPPPAAFDHPNSYLATPTTSYGYRTSHAPSASSSQTPSLYAASDAEYDPPTRQRSTRYSATVIHNPPAVPPSSPSQRPAGTSSGSYRTSRVAPRDTYTPDYQDPLDYDAFADRSSYASSGVPEVNRRAKSGDERQKQSKSGRRQEDSERQAAEERAKAERENARHVHFELGRAESRAKERAERHLAEKEKDRAAAREEARRLKEEERLKPEKKDLEEKMAQERKKERSKPPTTDYSNKRPSAARPLSSSSWTPAQLADQQRLIEAEKAQMRSERQVAEAREREEELATLKSQQEKPGYWDPRGGDRSLSTRRDSMTRHDSVTSTPRPSGLTRTASKRRTSISQPNPPAFEPQVPTETHSVRPSSSRKRAPPPLSFPANFNQEHARPPSARRPSFGQDNPFAASSSVMSPSPASQDPWDLRNVGSALPATRPLNDGRYGTTQPRSYVDPFATDSDSPGDHMPAYASRTGLSRKGSKRKP